ncbi:MAG: hypothetical protein AB7N91_17000 [Candidatus Tectimicrobiota bacterium]
METRYYIIPRIVKQVLRRSRLALLLSCWLLSQSVSGTTQPPAGEPPEVPITTEQSKVGALLRAWAAEGTAAGNISDWYDNRDRGHSELTLALWPQLQKVSYTDAERQRQADWASQGRVLPFVVFGNSSTAASVKAGGSNARQLYTHPLGIPLLAQQYRHNNLYIYPEHVDHDPGHNGRPGYGDLYPTNTPYLLISQGSSGSDQPFMRAIAFTLAAFRPEVKHKLAATGTLMPTLQMILRTCNSHLSHPQEYLTGKAHPTVFEGQWIDVEKMVLMAHALTLETLPPVAQLQVLEEDMAHNGQDFFDAPALPAEMLAQRYPQAGFVQRNLEQHADTPAVIARIHRSRHLQRRMVVSAATSFDLNHSPLTFHWVVLRGDPARVQIRPLDAAGTQAEILFSYTGRRPVSPGSRLESNRTDVGIFVHNGSYYSAPAFLTLFSLDSEARTYDSQGRPLEIGYGMGETVVKVRDWLQIFHWLEPDTPGAAAQLLRRLFPATEREALLHLATRYRQARKAEEEAASRRQEAQATQARQAAALQLLTEASTGTTAQPQAPDSARQAAWEADIAAQEARQAHTAAQRTTAGLLTQQSAQQPLSVAEQVEQRMRELAQHPYLFSRYAPYLEPLWQEASPQTRAAVLARRQELAAWGVVQDSPGLPLLFTPLRAATDLSEPVEARLTPFEQALVTRFQAAFLTQVVFPEVLELTFLPYYVDPGLTAAKFWRDVYHYDADGRATGWTRFDGQQRLAFNAAGQIIEAWDATGRGVKARTVLYEREARTPTGHGPSLIPNLNPLRMQPGPEFVYYEYTGPTQAQPREVKREAVHDRPTP